MGLGFGFFMCVGGGGGLVGDFLFFIFWGCFVCTCTLVLLLGVFLWLLLASTEDELFSFPSSSSSSSSSPSPSKRVAATTLTCYRCYKCHDSLFLPPRHQPPSAGAGALVVHIERLLTRVLVCVCLGKPEKETTNERKKERKKEEERERERNRQRCFGSSFVGDQAGGLEVLGILEF